MFLGGFITFMQNTTLLQAEQFTTILENLAEQLVEKHGACQDVMLVGIQRRGADLAHRLHTLLQNRTGQKIPIGSLDINLYRDDWTSLDAKPHIGQSNIAHDVDGMTIVLVDDVLYTGRTIRAALEALLDYGRPKKVELLVLVDRGHRELPIEANYVGRYVETQINEHVNVLVTEHDGKDAVLVTRA